MEYIEIKNLIFYNKEINLSFKENEVIGIFGENKNLINEFLLIVSGINKGKGDITYLNNDLFDNSLYFKNRLFFDFSKVYTKTLKKEFIHENLKNRFGLSFDEEKFKRLIKELKIRKETTIDVSYTFTKLGNTLVNFSLVSSLKYKNLIISNPTIYLKEKEQIEIIRNELTNKEKYSNVILNLDNISNFSNSLDRIVLVTRDNEFKETNVNDKIVVIEDNIYLRNIICKAKDNYVICYHDYEKEELKKFDKLKIKYKLISIYDIDKYLEVKYE